MASNITSSRRTGESVLTEGRTIRKGGSRSSSQGPRTLHKSPPPALLELLDNILNFSKILLRQEASPLTSDFPLGPSEGSEPLEEQMADTATALVDDYGSSDLRGEMEWGEICPAIKLELNRLVMWKFEVTQRRKLSPAFQEESPVYSVICESILSIGDTLMFITSTQFIMSSPDANLRLRYKTVERCIEHFRSRPNSTCIDEQPSANTRMRKSAVDGVQQGNLLQMLRSDIKRLVCMVDTMVAFVAMTT